MLKSNSWILCTIILLFCVYVEYSRVSCEHQGGKIEEIVDVAETAEDDEYDDSNELNGEHADKERFIFSLKNKKNISSIFGSKNISSIFGSKNISSLLPSKNITNLFPFPFPFKPNASSQTQPTLKCQCGKSNDHNKIVGGGEAKDHAWPWMASICYVGDGSQPPMTVCGGSIINTRFILTAAHCVPAIIDGGLDQFQIFLGDNKIENASSTQKRLAIQSIRTHPKYDEKTMDYDAALIKLATPLTFSSYITPICLGQKGAGFVNRQAVVCGWGSTFFGGQGVDSLREVRVKVITNAKCKAQYESNSQTITDNMLCATAPGKDSCQGDSGGPLFVNRTLNSNIYKQIGIVSFGVDCADPTHSGVYTRIQKILSWIKALTSKDGQYCNTSFLY